MSGRGCRRRPRAGATLRWAEFEPATGILPAEQYTDLVNDRTRVVAVTAASNAIGGRPDVAAIAAIAHAAGALIYVDGVHATPHAPTDVAALGADFYTTSAYKWSGPHLAACAASPDLWESLRPEKLMPSSDEIPDRFEFGTPSFELLAGVAGAVDHLADLTGGEGERRERIVGSLRAAQAYEMDLFTRLVGELAEIPGIAMCPAPEQPVPDGGVPRRGPASGRDRDPARRRGRVRLFGRLLRVRVLPGREAPRQRRRGTGKRVSLQQCRRRGAAARRHQAMSMTCSGGAAGIRWACTGGRVWGACINPLGYPVLAASRLSTRRFTIATPRSFSRVR